MNLFFTSYISLILLIFSLSCQAQGLNQKSNGFNTTYQLQTVSGMSLDKRALLGGAVISSAQVSLSAKTSGDVIEVYGREGDVFKKGSVLAVLEQNSLQAEKDSADAEIASANEALRNASVRYSQSIVSPNSGSPFGSIGGMFSTFTDPMMRFSGQGNPDFDKFANRTSRYTEFQQAKNKLRQAHLHLQQVKDRLKDASVIAPFDGVIIVKNIQQGDVVQAGQVLMKFANIKKLQVEVNVPSRLVSSLKINKQYRIKLDITNTVVSAVLSQVYPIADNNKHSVKVKFDLPLEIPVLVGAYAEVEIFETDSGILTPVIPERAIMWRSSLPSIFIIDPRTNQTQLRFIRLGEQVGQSRKSVLSGLSIGEKIVTNPNILMVSGMAL